MKEIKIPFFFLILLIPFVFNFYSNFDKYLDYINYLKIDKKTQKLVKSHDKRLILIIKH